MSTNGCSQHFNSQIADAPFSASSWYTFLVVWSFACLNLQRKNHSQRILHVARISLHSMCKGLSRIISPQYIKLLDILKDILQLKGTYQYFSGNSENWYFPGNWCTPTLPLKVHGNQGYHPIILSRRYSKVSQGSPFVKMSPSCLTVSIFNRLTHCF